MSDETFWLLIWLLVVSGVVSVIGVSCHAYNENTRILSEHGFVRQQIPNGYSMEWVHTNSGGGL